MKARQQRMLAVGLTVAGIAIAATLTLEAFKENMMFFIDITDVVNGEYPQDRDFRVGGLVVAGSVTRKPGDLRVSFDLTDLGEELTVTYNDILPDLFREGQGIIAHGRMNEQGTFVAHDVLAKHDEKYMPPEVGESLAKHVAEKEAAMNSEPQDP